MDKLLPKDRKPAPFIAIYADGKGPQTLQDPLRPEPPTVMFAPYRWWTSCLTSGPDRPVHLADLVPPKGDPRPPLNRVAATLMGTWDPGRHPDIVLRGQHPTRPEKSPPAGAPVPAAGVASRAHDAGVRGPPGPDVLAAVPRAPATGEPEETRHHLMRPEKSSSGSAPVLAAEVAARAHDAGGRDTPRPDVLAAVPRAPAAGEPEEVRHHPIRPEEPLHTSPLRNGNRQGNPNAAPRCCARTRLGSPCRGPAMKNGKCRMHGGASTGAKTEEGRARIAAAKTIHGFYGAEMREFRARIAAMKRRGRALCAFTKAGLPLDALAPLLRQARQAEPRGERRSNGNTPCAQKTEAPGADEAMLALLTADLSARQTTLLTGLIRARGGQARTRRPSAAFAREHPMRPENAVLGRGWGGAGGGARVKPEQDEKWGSAAVNIVNGCRWHGLG